MSPIPNALFAGVLQGSNLGRVYVLIVFCYLPSVTRWFLGTRASSCNNHQGIYIAQYWRASLGRHRAVQQHKAQVTGVGSTGFVITG